MSGINQVIYNKSPHYIKNIFVTIYNLKWFTIHNKRYRFLIKKYREMFFEKNLNELKKIQENKFLKFIDFSKKNNQYYQNKLHNIAITSLEDITKIPILNKDDLLKDDLKSEINDTCFVGYTGGTTGKSLKYFLTKNDYIERQSCLDFFRSLHGYSFGNKIAWFSGKEIITDKELKKNIFWVKDYINKIIYYSTFHMRDEYIDKMIDNLNKEKPEYFSGFPSAIYELTNYWEKSGKPIEFQLNAIFTTSEPFFQYQKEKIQTFFNCIAPDQYASSEGAPFIYECPFGQLHYDMYSGIFEKISGTNEVLVTSFTTHKMPLIRYKIGDSIEFDDSKKSCSCGSKMPLIKKIIGRSMSFVYSRERGKVGVTNIANSIKYIKGIEKLQLVQNEIDTIIIKLVLENTKIKKDVKKQLEYELRYRLGDNIDLIYNIVKNIPCEKNGKYMMIKNNLKEKDLI